MYFNGIEYDNAKEAKKAVKKYNKLFSFKQYKFTKNGIIKVAKEQNYLDEVRNQMLLLSAPIFVMLGIIATALIF